MDGPARLKVRRALAALDETPAEEAGLDPSAVMALVYPGADGHVVLLSRRSEALARHPGEIAFPGGGFEPDDPTLEHTALRELFEEVGVAPEDVDVLGELGRFTTSSNYLITCFVGTIQSPYEFRINSEEVDSLLEVPVRALLGRDVLRDDVRVVGGDLVSLPSFAYDGRIIFGATARILDRLTEVLSGIWPEPAVSSAPAGARPMASS